MASVVDSSGWVVGWLPVGFKMRNHNLQTMEEREVPGSHMVYSDGLAMVLKNKKSLYQTIWNSLNDLAIKAYF